MIIVILTTVGGSKTILSTVQLLLSITFSQHARICINSQIIHQKDEEQKDVIAIDLDFFFNLAMF